MSSAGLYALTKADNLGLALIALGTALLAADLSMSLKLMLIWFFVALAAATSGHLIARHALRAGRGSCENGGEKVGHGSGGMIPRRAA